MVFNPGRTKRSMEWNGYLAAELAAAVDGYRELLRTVEVGALDEDDQDLALEWATGACAMLRDLSPHLDRMIDTLPPALQPVRPMEILELIADSSLAMLALGSDHDLILDETQLDELISEPYTAHWVRLLLDGPASEDDLADQRPMRASRPATDDELDEVRTALRGLVPTLVDQYGSLHARQPLQDEGAVEEALDLAIQIAVVLRGAQSDGRDLRSYPPELVYAQTAVLAPCLQSLVAMATGNINAEPPLAPATLRTLIEGAYGHAMLR